MNQLILMIMPKKIILVLVGLSVILNYTLGLHQNGIYSKRIYNAETLLQNTQYNINEIAQIIGYDNPLYFSRVFQRQRNIAF